MASELLSKSDLKIERGSPLPYGVFKHLDGYNFSLFSKHAKAVSLCLFKENPQEPPYEIPLDPKKNKTGTVWHVRLQDIGDYCHYGYRIDGPYDPLKGVIFDKRHIVLDPFAPLVASPHGWGEAPDNPYVHKGVIDPFEPFDWGDDAGPLIPKKDLIIYEMHVRGFTQDPSSKVQSPGTFAGIIEKIDYLKSLGVNAVELMPIHEFNERDNARTHPETNEPLFQYWGYSTVNFFAPMRRYSRGNALTEFKQLVKALHAHGIEVILDVVYNHTAEGSQSGPSISFKGIDNSVYYMLGPNGEYYNFTGCGNTFNCNHPVVRQFILASLRYWVTEMHVDGFRFDLASILVRSHDGIPLENPPLIEAISLDPILANTKLIAEAWDAAGLYQVGSFPGRGIWSEWNGRYRDDVRAFVKGTDGKIGAFATRLSGSEDLYQKTNPDLSINFITAHDGFSLADLVSYNEKHNLENGEENRDGDNNNQSWNCGEEGETEDPHILALRLRQMKNYHVALMVSQGIPMILMGDEYGHTKKGNNNTWALDSRINWFLWDEWEKKPDFFRFYKLMIHFRKMHPILTHTRFLKKTDIIWHGKEPSRADWSAKSRFLAFTLLDPTHHYDLYIAFNASHESVTFKLPEHPPEKPWKRIVNTSKNAPEDFLEEPLLIKTKSLTLPAYSSLILKS